MRIGAGVAQQICVAFMSVAPVLARRIVLSRAYVPGSSGRWCARSHRPGRLVARARGEQTGLKIHVQFTIAGGQPAALLLDFRSDRSFHRTGSGTWILNPTAIAAEVLQQPPHSGGGSS